MSSMKGLTIGEVAKQAEVNVETLRYYERRGILPIPPRSGANYRRYPETAVRQARSIKRAQGLGFSLDEIRELLSLGDGHCDDVRRVAENQRALVAARIADLAAMQDTLDGLIDRCRNAQVSNHCPLIETLSRRD